MSAIRVVSDTAVNEQDKTVAIPDAGKGARIHSVRVEYTATAVAGTRTLEVRYLETGGDVVWATEIVTDYVASDVRVVNLSPAAALLAPADAGDEGSQHCAGGMPANGSVRVIATAGSDTGDDMVVHVVYEID